MTLAVSSDGTSQVPQNQNQGPAPASDWKLPCLPLGKDTELGSLGLFNRASETALDTPAKLLQVPAAIISPPVL